VKPKHQGGYTPLHAEFCERTLVTLLRGLGPWKAAICLVGGLVPRYLIDRSAEGETPPHAGTTDVDIVVDLEILAQTEAYRRLEQNLKALGFVRGTNEEGNVQHYSWRRSVGSGITVIVDLLCDASFTEGGQVAVLPGERRLSALKVPGAHLAMQDNVGVELTANLLDEGGVATETIRVAGIVPFVVLKALAYQDRFEEKDAYDLIYCLSYYRAGPVDVAAAFAHSMQQFPDEPLFAQAVAILRDRFTADEYTPGTRKDGPVSYARFLTDPGRSDLDARCRQEAAGVVQAFLLEIDRLSRT
jgi:predicted nucleotidyltransferase